MGMRDLRFGFGVETRGLAVRIFLGLGWYVILELGYYPNLKCDRAIEFLYGGPRINGLKHLVPYEHQKEG